MNSLSEQIRTLPGGQAIDLAVDEKPFRLAKSFSMIAIVMIFAVVLTLAAVVSRQAETIITKRVEDDTIKLMENLNLQMYEDFLKAAQAEFGEIRLREPLQKDMLTGVINKTIYGFDIRRVQIYDLNCQVVYVNDQTLQSSHLADAMDSYLEAIRLYALQEPDLDAVINELRRDHFERVDTEAAFRPPHKRLLKGLPFNLLLSDPVLFNLVVSGVTQDYQPVDPYQFFLQSFLNREIWSLHVNEMAWPKNSQDLQFAWSWNSTLQENIINYHDVRSPLEDDAYLDRLRALTAFRYEGGRYLFFNFFPRGDFVLRTFKAMENYGNQGLSGVLELSRDLTPEYRQIARLQYFSFSVAVFLALILTIVLRRVVSRGEAIITKRNLERQTLQQRLDQAERLAGLGSMVATVAHEIRNPLGIIHSTADVLNRFLSEEDPARARLAGAIVEEANRLSEVVTEFLDFARPPAPRLEPTVVEEILEEILAFLEVTLSRAGVEVRTCFRENQTTVNGDAHMLHRAFLNILMNAVQAMTDGGLLTVRTFMEPAGQGSENLVIAITDTGPGISEESSKKLFSPFYTTKAKGTGLGLVIVRNIIEAHGGSIEMKNGPKPAPDDGGGPGVTVFIRLKSGS